MTTVIRDVPTLDEDGKFPARFIPDAVFDAEAAAEAAATSAGEARDEVFTAVAAQSDWSGAHTLTQTLSRSTYLRRRLTGNVILTANMGIAGRAYSCTLELQQDATGGRTLTLANVATPYGVAIALSSPANAVDIVRLEWNGARWAAFLGGAQLAIPASWVV